MELMRVRFGYLCGGEASRFVTISVRGRVDGIGAATMVWRVIVEAC